MKLSKEKLLSFYRTMQTIRLFESHISDLYARGTVPGFAHLYIGEEAVAAGVCGALREDDYITSTHRGHGHVIAKGADLKPMMAELFGKKTGYCKGKGGSMHIADMNIGILGANGIAGGGIPIAVGAGRSAIKLRGTDQVAVCFFGDASPTTGPSTRASTWPPCTGSRSSSSARTTCTASPCRQAKHQAIKDIAIRATSYDMPGVVVDGNDVMEVYEAVVQGVRRARAGEGPTLIECKTYRWRGHHEGDPNQGRRYRTKEEIEAVEEEGPDPAAGRQAAGGKDADQEEDRRHRSQDDEEIDQAVAFANRERVSDRGRNV